MDVLLRCRIPDVTGRLAMLAGAIAEAGGDIQAVEVVQVEDGTAIDDVWVRTDDLTAVVDGLTALQDCEVVHAGVSRGQPGDATARLAAGIDALMSGAMSPDTGIATVVGGLLQANTAEVVPNDGQPHRKDRRTLRLPVAGGMLVLTREYRFLDDEVQQAAQVLRVCEQAAAMSALT